MAASKHGLRIDCTRRSTPRCRAVAPPNNKKKFGYPSRGQTFGFPLDKISYEYIETHPAIPAAKVHTAGCFHCGWKSARVARIAMKLSAMARLLLVCVAPSYWQNHGHVDAMSLSSFPLYCSKDMERNVVPSLADSVSSSFGDSVSPGDVQLLQVRGQVGMGSRADYFSDLDRGRGASERTTVVLRFLEHVPMPRIVPIETTISTTLG